MEAKLRVAASSEIKIDKGVPFVPSRREGVSKYPWATLEVGDSFLFPPHVEQAAYNLALHNSKNGRVFKAKKTADGYRCWRVS